MSSVGAFRVHKIFLLLPYNNNSAPTVSATFTFPSSPKQTMIVAKNVLFLAFGVTSMGGQASAACTSIESITCAPTSTAPTLDGNSEEWSSVEQFETPLTGALTSVPYPRGSGSAKIRCSYDAERIYFLFEVPGAYRFSTEDNHHCASISTMFKMGEDATFFNMGGCPLGDKCESDPEGCESYKVSSLALHTFYKMRENVYQSKHPPPFAKYLRPLAQVDLGGHWELKTTTMGVAYGTNEDTGNDLVANKDDEYSVYPTCRYDDDDAKAANEWEGAWLHSNPTAAERSAAEDVYVFEMARSLQTASAESDAQLEPGTAIDFGIAFWVCDESLVLNPISMCGCIV
ncbi:hypothetical protein ACHAWF_016741 [Thalassiosira exigua]